MSEKFKIHDRVKWSSQSAGRRTLKRGTVLAGVQDRQTVEDALGAVGKSLADFALRTGEFGMVRNHTSYLVAVTRMTRGQPSKGRPVLYWPRTLHLEGEGA